MKTITGRDIAAMLNPRLSVLVTCCDSNGQPNVLTVAWHTPLSHRPPLVGISIGQTRYSRILIGENRDFAINIVGKSSLEAVKLCGTLTGELDQKLEIANLETRAAETIRPPVLAASLGVLECRVIDQVETGDHTFFIGEILLAQVHEEFFKNAWKPKNGDVPLMCLQRDLYGTFIEMETKGF